MPFGKPLSCPLGVAVVPPERFLLGEVGWAAAAAAAAAACAAAVTVRRARAYALWDRQGVRIVLASQSRAERGERARNVPQQPLDGRLERVLDGEHEYAALGVPQDAGRELGRVGERAGRERQAEAQVEGCLLGGTSGGEGVRLGSAHVHDKALERIRRERRTRIRPCASTAHCSAASLATKRSASGRRTRAALCTRRNGRGVVVGSLPRKDGGGGAGAEVDGGAVERR